MSEQVTDGGPAFPTTKPLDGWGDPNKGMSLREYFAAHAPQAPDWFKQKNDSPHPYVRPRADSEDEETYLSETLGAREIREQWINRQRANKFFAWRWFYADSMISARGQE